MPRRLWLMIGGAALLLGLGSPTAAIGGDISSDDLGRLVDEARTDRDALNQLENITSINGEPSDLGPLLDTSPDLQQQRLDTLQRLLRSDGLRRDGDMLRSEAEDITSHPPFTGAVASRGGILARVGEFLSRLLGGTAAQGLALVALMGAVFAAAFLIMDRRTSRRRRASTGRSVEQPESPVDYRGKAERAAATGEFAAAVRLLFVDGTTRLEAEQIVDNAATTSTATVRPLTDETRFLDRFDAIAYGGAQAADTDVDEARGAWDRLMTRLGTR